MTYWNLESAARNSAKVRAVGKDGFVLWSMCALYAAEQLTDGFVPQEEVEKILREWNLDNGTLAKCLASLVPGKLSLLDAAKGGVAVHDWDDYNPEASRIKRLSADRRRAGRIGAESKHSGKCQKQVSEASASSTGQVGRLVGSSDPGAVDQARAHVGSMAPAAEGTGLPGIIAREWVEVLAETGVSAIPDQTGGGVAEEHLRHLEPDKRLAVLRAFRDDADPWVVKHRQLRFLDAGRVNGYLAAAAEPAFRVPNFMPYEWQRVVPDEPPPGWVEPPPTPPRAPRKPVPRG